MHLAQLNIAQARHNMDAPEMQEFVNAIAAVNEIADNSAGFVWRLQDESGDATGISAFDDPGMLVNLSVWETSEQLKDFMFKSLHRDYLRRKREWFDKMPTAYFVMWWIPEGHIPSLQEALQRLEHLRTEGETPYAFSFRSDFKADDLND